MMSCDYLTVLNLAKQGKWDDAHKIVQNYSDQMSCLIHGYLHRVEGDESNARYWYHRAESEFLDNTLEQELERLFQLVTESS